MRGGVKLRLWIEARGIKKQDFAKKARISRPSLSNYLSGVRIPGIEVAKRISKATEEDVKIEDWIAPRKKKNK